MAKVKVVEYIGEVMREIHFDEFSDFMQYELRDEQVSSVPGVKLVEPEAVTAGIEVGKEYRVIGNSNGHEFKVGDVVRITGAADAEDEYTAEYLDHSDYWYVVAKDLGEV